MGKITGIHHLCVNTPDIEKSLCFYRDILGFRLLDRETCAFGEYAMLRLGTSNLELIQPNHPGEDSFGNHGALAHFGLQTEGLDQVFASFVEKGVPLVSKEIEEFPEPMGGLRAVSLIGPSGEAINLYEFKRAF